MVTLLKAPDITAELFVEVLGALANLNIPEFDFLGLARKHDMLSFLAQYAQPGAVDDDILLEVRGVFKRGQGAGFAAWARWGAECASKTCCASRQTVAVDDDTAS